MSVALRPSESRLVNWLGLAALVGGIAFAVWYGASRSGTEPEAGDANTRSQAIAPHARSTERGPSRDAVSASDVSRAGPAVAPAASGATVASGAAATLAASAGHASAPAAIAPNARRRDVGANTAATSSAPAPAVQPPVRQAVRQRAAATRPATAPAARVETGRVGSLRADIARYNAERGEAPETRRWSAGAGAESSWVNNPQSYDSIYRN
ncbi:hypothetical protein [Chitinasiproducens palmae]|uniref:Uncharacterized protein n=1 Tax=Chitinasiproducens palmae TaxID=1770053 RepID=A0A1H2PNY8_9BURK|nr:hypothetical protein [Chitinasiproducens palmae]SDV48392.1 hypothetical protein SAMN05216551_10554 [Chitinasiproducens palmae]